MIIQITAYNLLPVPARLLIAEVEVDQIPENIHRFAISKLIEWNRERPMDRVYQLDNVLVLK